MSSSKFGDIVSERDRSATEDGPANRDWIPSCWSADARAIPGAYRFGESVRPWNWLELTRSDAERLWSLLFGFVTFFNARYGERTEKRIPPCWVEHGPLVEELTTLVFARWHAFESPHASVGGAQYWHSYTLPSFYDRVREWLGDDLLACQQGRHRDHHDASPSTDLEWLARGLTVSDLDVAIRVADPEEDATPVTESPHGIEIPFLDAPVTERTAPTHLAQLPVSAPDFRATTIRNRETEAVARHQDPSSTRNHPFSTRASQPSISQGERDANNRNHPGA